MPLVTNKIPAIIKILVDKIPAIIKILVEGAQSGVALILLI